MGEAMAAEHSNELLSDALGSRLISNGITSDLASISSNLMPVTEPGTPAEYDILRKALNFYLNVVNEHVKRLYYRDSFNNYILNLEKDELSPKALKIILGIRERVLKNKQVKLHNARNSMEEMERYLKVAKGIFAQFKTVITNLLSIYEKIPRIKGKLRTRLQEIKAAYTMECAMKTITDIRKSISKKKKITRTTMKRDSRCRALKRDMGFVGNTMNIVDQTERIFGGDVDREKIKQLLDAVAYEVEKEDYINHGPFIHSIFEEFRKSIISYFINSFVVKDVDGRIHSEFARYITKKDMASEPEGGASDIFTKKGSTPEYKKERMETLKDVAKYGSKVLQEMKYEDNNAQLLFSLSHGIKELLSL